MALLQKALIQQFYRSLAAAEYLCDFDRQFLSENTVDSLLSFDTDYWIQHIYASRLILTRMSNFDWVNTGSDAQIDWTQSAKHANAAWYNLASIIAKQTGMHLSEILFSGVKIANKDREFLRNPLQFAHLIYTNNFNRLIVLNRCFSVSKETPYNFSGYKQDGTKRPFSPLEFSQIRKKLSSFNRYYKPTVVSNWDAFKEHYGNAWKNKPVGEKFNHVDNLIYPLFRIVELYFSEVEGVEKPGTSFNALHDFYKNDLRDLNPKEVNYFFGQCIDTDNNLALYEIVSLMSEDCLAILPLMVKLAVWITQKNPAMVIMHQEVVEKYRDLEIGPFFTQKKLAEELTILARFYRENKDEDTDFIDQLAKRLSIEQKPISELDLFKALSEIFKRRDDFNRNEIIPKTTNKKIIIYTACHYVYHETGANAQYIKIARLLAGWGFLRRHGILDYFQLLMPALASPQDIVTGAYLSTLPLNHYIKPDNDETYLISLSNSKDYYEFKGLYYNINSNRANALSPNEYDSIWINAPDEFQKYPRIPKYTKHQLGPKTLQALTNLVNHSLNYEATEKYEGYQLKKGFSESPTQVAPKVVEYILGLHSISYQIRDSWAPKRVLLNTDGTLTTTDEDNIHTDDIVFANPAERKRFLNSDEQQRLLFILNIALGRGHARSNLSINKYYMACLAYIKFANFYQALDCEERERLNQTSIRTGSQSFKFEEVWQDGNPKCMAMASKCFAILILDHLPALQFASHIEYDSNNPKGNDYLYIARRDSQNLYAFFHDNNLSVVNELTEKLSHATSWITSLAGCKAWLGVENESSVDQETSELLSISDSIPTPKLQGLTFFNNGKRTGYPLDMTGSVVSDDTDHHSDSSFDDTEHHEVDALFPQTPTTVSVKTSRSVTPRSSVTSASSVSDANEYNSNLVDSARIRYRLFPNGSEDDSTGELTDDENNFLSRRT